jgi:hypothetical protein
MPTEKFDTKSFRIRYFSVGKTVYDLLICAKFFGVNDTKPEDALVSIPLSCLPFKSGKSRHLISGSADLFLFPSVLYSQIAAVSQLPGPDRARDASRGILRAVDHVIAGAASHTQAEKILVDTSLLQNSGARLPVAPLGEATRSETERALPIRIVFSHM